MADDITVTLSAGGKSIELRPRRNGAARGAGADLESQMELEGMPAPEKKQKEYNPYREAFELAPFVPAPEVKRLAEDLIPENHAPRWKAVPEIIYLFSDKPPKAQGEDATATCRKIGGINAYLWRLLWAQTTQHNGDEYNQARWRHLYESRPNWRLPEGKHVVEATPLFVITWHYDAWNLADDLIRQAITDHELQHIGVEYNSRGDGLRHYVIPHTLQEFHAIVERWGAYAPDLASFKEALERSRQPKRESGIVMGGRR